MTDFDAKWNLENLHESLELLALDGEAQVAWLDDHPPFGVDEVALHFDDVYGVVDQLVKRGDVPRSAFTTIQEINSALDELDKRPELYEDEPLRTSPEWEHIRKLGRRALAELKEG